MDSVFSEKELTVSACQQPTTEGRIERSGTKIYEEL